MKTRKTSRLMTLLVVFMMLLSSVTVFADDDSWKVVDKVSIPSADAAAAKKAIDTLKADGNSSNFLESKAGVSGTAVAIATIDGTVITFNKGAFQNATDKSRKKAVKDFVKVLSNSDVSEQTQQNVFEQMSNSDRDLQAMMIPLIFDSTSADLYTAMKWVTPILGVFRVIMGIGSIVLVMLILGSTLMDCVYIGIPMSRGNKEGGSNDKPFGVSYDAISVVKEVESSLDGSNKYKNAYLIYLRRRAITYIVFGICLLYLIVGELGGLMSWLMSLGSGIVS